MYISSIPREETILMEYKITKCGKDSFDLTLSFSFLEYLDGQGEIYQEELKLNLKNQRK